MLEPVGPATLVISLDFEIHWGVRDHHTTSGPYRDHLLGVRRAIPGMLSLFKAYDVAATWATVGFLFARSRQEMDEFRPQTLPRYSNARLDPYGESVGQNETDDPFHYGGDLIEQIRATPRQEIASHTYSHYYCLEKGQDAQAFRADLKSANLAARARGIALESMVFPRNQHNAEYDELLREAGYKCYRGNPSKFFYSLSESRTVRMCRLLDSFVSLWGPNSYPWHETRLPNGLVDVKASLFLRPVTGLAPLDRLRRWRIERLMTRAAQRGEIVHLWWHPHNFGSRTRANLDFLEHLLQLFARLRERYGMVSLTMAEVAARARQLEGASAR